MDYNRVNLLLAVLEKRLNLKLGNQDVYVNIAGGIRINEPAIDLGVVLAVVSSYKDKPIDEKVLVFGEVGLSGEVRAVSQASQRVQEAKKLGFTTVILPEVCREQIGEVKGIRLCGVRTVADAVRLI
jgi:DNA repair protein RadA/Sms